MAETAVRFGMLLEIDGQQITLQPKTAIDKLKDEPIELELPPGAEITMNVSDGLEAFISRISTTFGGGAVKIPKDLPAPMDTVVDYLASIDVTIYDFWVKMQAEDVAVDDPGKAGEKKTVKKFGKPKHYRIGIYVKANPLALFGSVKFNGFVVQIAAGDGLR